MSNFVAVMIAALVGELLLLLLVLLLVAWFRNRAARIRDNKAIRVLVARVKNARIERETQIGRFLGEQMAMTGDALEHARTAIQRAELALLQRFAGVYKKRDAGAAAQFDIDLVAALAPYYELSGSGEAHAAEQTAVDPSELEALRAENTRLSEELSVTMETMSRMLNEYSSMFAGGSSGTAAPVAALIGAAAGADDHSQSGTETRQETSVSDADDDIEVDLKVAAATEMEDDADVDFAAEAVVEGLTNADVAAAPGAGGETEEQDADGGQDADQDDIDKVNVEVAAATETEDDADVDSTAEAVVEVLTDADVAAAPGAAGETEEQDAGGGHDADQDEIDALLNAEGHDDLVDLPDPESPAVEVLDSDDLDVPAGLFEEGAAEVVAFDETGDFDVELAILEDELSDSPGSDSVFRAQAVLDERADSVEEPETGDTDHLFDAVDEPLKTRSGP